MNHKISQSKSDQLFARVARLTLFVGSMLFTACETNYTGQSNGPGFLLAPSLTRSTERISQIMNLPFKEVAESKEIAHDIENQHTYTWSDKSARPIPGVLGFGNNHGPCAELYPFISIASQFVSRGEVKEYKHTQLLGSVAGSSVDYTVDATFTLSDSLVQAVGNAFDFILYFTASGGAPTQRVVLMRSGHPVSKTLTVKVSIVESNRSFGIFGGTSSSLNSDGNVEITLKPVALFITPSGRFSDESQIREDWYFVKPEVNNSAE